MKLTIAPELFGLFPALLVGVVVVKGAKNQGAAHDLRRATADLSAGLRASFSSGALSQHPKISVWRHAYAAFGAKPKENKSSVESLYRAVLGGRELRSINPLVDIYNFISLKHMLPVGGEDLDSVRGDIRLTFAGNEERPVVLLGDSEARPPHPGEVIYRDDLSAICRRWNWRECERTKITESTTNCVLVVEALPPGSRDEIRTALDELSSLATGICGAECVLEIMDRTQTEFPI